MLEKNPIRSCLLTLFVFVFFSLAPVGIIQRFAALRFAEIISGLVLLIGFYVSREFDLRQKVVPWFFGLGLWGAVLAALVFGFTGSAPMISLAFVGLLLAQFAMFPLVRAAWRKYEHDCIRILAVFALTILSLDVFHLLQYGWLGLEPYQLIGPGSNVSRVLPSLHFNSRWANQVAVLVVWSYIPLVTLLEGRAIDPSRRRLWLFVAWMVPFLAFFQMAITGGRAAILSCFVGLILMFLRALSSKSESMPVVRKCFVIAVVSFLLAYFAALVVDSGDFIDGMVRRTALDLVDEGGGPPRRWEAWIAFFQGSLQNGLLGAGIPLIPSDSLLCTPHNLLLALLFWLGLPGLFCVLMMLPYIIPVSFVFDGAQAMAMPFLATLFTYQLFDDIWLRPLPLAVLIVVLPIFGGTHTGLQPARGILRIFEFRLSSYRFFSLLGFLMISLSLVSPEGIAIGPSPLISLPTRACLLFF